MSIDSFRSTPLSVVRESVLRFASGETNAAIIKEALRVRAVETTLLSLFSQGKLHGTIHTCVGQELVATIVTGALRQKDFVTSNHRGHGHFIGVTKNWRGLIDEIVGNADGICGGVGGSQHLFEARFLSNGQQGGLVPVAAGIALDGKRISDAAIAVAFIGEGTLGEGVVYETMNIASLWELPLLIVCENNFYSQSTPQARGLAGDILARGSAFGMDVYRGNTWFPGDLVETTERAIFGLRNGTGPAFFQIETYRLNPHSKGDDNRPAAELSDFSARDPLNILLNEVEYKNHYNEILEETRLYAEHALVKPKLTLKEYASVPDKLHVISSREIRDSPDKREYFSKAINRFYSELMDLDPKVVFLGEDIADPYGGAFKITDGLSLKYPGRVFSTPISEAAIVGLAIGLAIKGSRPVVEVMFGDFMTFVVDQLINNASKIRFMSRQKLACPLIIRTPMGGGRGYGPTHSQSLEKHFIGIPDTVALSLNSLIDVGIQLAAVEHTLQPLIIFENKVDYTKRMFIAPKAYDCRVTQGLFPTAVISPRGTQPSLTILSYGGMSRLIAENLIEIFLRTDLVPELIVPTALFPLDIDPICKSTMQTGRLATIEEGTLFASFGSEAIAQVAQKLSKPFSSIAIGSLPIPIPSEPSLELLILPNLSSICEKLIIFKTENFS